MFTECPECGIAFRVTAKVLQQAKGNVRCGGCNHAFSALEYLSEEMPGVIPADSDSVSDDDLAETSRRLLKTLDELAGSSEVRIEDTGVEWRVLEDNLDGDDSTDDDSTDDDSTDDDSTDDDSTDDDSTDNEEVSETRYDDNSPLPDDLDELARVVEEEAAAESEALDDKPRVEFTESDDDVALSEPEEWTDLLEEVRESDVEEVAVEEVAVETSDDEESDHGVLAESDEAESELVDEIEQEDVRDAVSEAQKFEHELAALDAQILSEKVASKDIENEDLADLDTQFNLQAEALGLSTTGIREALIDEAALPDESTSDTTDEATAEDDPGEEDAHDENDVAEYDEEALAVDDSDVAVSHEDIDSEVGSEEDHDDLEEKDAAAGLESANSDADYETAEDEHEVQTEAEAEDEHEDGEEEEEEEEDEDLAVAEAEEEDEDLAVAQAEYEDVEHEAIDDNEEESEQVEADAFETDEDVDSLTVSKESTSEFEAQIEVAANALSGIEDDEDAIDEEIAPDDDETNQDDSDDISLDFLALENQVADGEAVDEQYIASAGDHDEADLTGETKHYVPEPTEEELTVNMEIDQEMMALAQQDDEFSATLVGMATPEELLKQKPEEVEAIIMEGEIVRNAVEQERLAAEAAARSQLDDAGNVTDPYAVDLDKVRGGRRTYDPPAYTLIGGVIVLGLILVVQFVHNSREALATSGFFNQTIGPVYRAFGNPVTPEWDIKGWQFETTNGSIGEEENSLVIVSRLINQSDSALPYPLVHVSLTDRWEDIMGSRILEPSEYLAGAMDPSTNVPPGQNFTAVITIEDPAVEATGFKLNVCYRQEPGVVRCAIEDFK